MLERCLHCDEPTERSGAGEDSRYDYLGDGPYCAGCWSIVEDLNDALERLSGQHE
jgi:hypothetical protein